MRKVIAFNGSPRPDGNTSDLLRLVLQEVEKQGIETEIVQLSAKPIHGCIACYKCFENQDKRCSVKDDAANEYIEKMLACQGIILGSPSYFQGTTPEMKALIDRAGFVGLANDKMYKGRIGASVCCFRRTGGMHTIETMNHFFFSNEITIVGRALCVARDKGEVKKDAEGIQQGKTLGQQMASLLKELYK